MIPYSQKDLTAIASHMVVEELRNLGCFKGVEHGDSGLLPERKNDLIEGDGKGKERKTDC